MITAKLKILLSSVQTDTRLRLRDPSRLKTEVFRRLIKMPRGRLLLEGFLAPKPDPEFAGRITFPQDPHRDTGKHHEGEGRLLSRLLTTTRP